MQPAAKPMRKKLLAIASGGGHWLELCRIRPAFEGFDIAFVSVHPNYASQVPGCPFYAVRDVSRRDWWGVMVLVPQLARIILRERPDIVITTGSFPALFALAIAKLTLRTKTIWIDSIANVETLSSSGSLARYVADVHLTQWPGVARQSGPLYWGAVL